MKTKVLVVFLFIVLNSHPQNIEKFNFYAGIKLRVTPVYSPNLAENIVTSITGNINATQQPDYHLSGLGILTTQTYRINNQWLLNVQQVTRYDILYEEWPLDINVSYRKIKDKKRLIFDLNFELARRFKSKRSEFSALLGLGISGLNTSYNQIIRQYSNATEYIDYKEKINFQFPSVSAGFGWQKGKFLTQLKMGYCWQNPTWSIYSFFFPELSLQYRIK